MELNKKISKSDLFRSNALKHASQLFNYSDQSLRIFHPSGWLWLLFVFTLLLSFFLWVFLGEIENTVTAVGITLPENGQILPIMTTRRGEVSSVLIKPKEKVEKGVVLAKIFNPYVDQDFKYLQEKQVLHQKQLKQIRSMVFEKKQHLQVFFQERQDVLKKRLKVEKEKLNVLKDLMGKKAALFRQKYLTITELNQAKEKVILAQKALDQTQSEIKLGHIQFKEENALLEQKIREEEGQLLASQSAFKKKALEKEEVTTIKSPAAGLIMVSHIAKGDTIFQKDVLFTLIKNYSGDQGLEVLAFVSQSEGKKIEVGAKAYVSPSGVSSYRFGYIKGVVVEISDYPVTQAMAYSYLGNMDLVNALFRQTGSPFLVKVRLEKSEKTKNRLVWTTQKGPSFEINMGHSVLVKLVTEVVSPFQLLGK